MNELVIIPIAITLFFIIYLQAKCWGLENKNVILKKQLDIFNLDDFVIDDVEEDIEFLESWKDPGYRRRVQHINEWFHKLE